MADQPSITCPICGRTSYNPNDIREGYCGWCHDWTGVPETMLSDAELEAEYDQGDGYGRCQGCQSQEPVEVLAAFEGYCSSQCAREHADVRR